MYIFYLVINVTSNITMNINIFLTNYRKYQAIYRKNLKSKKTEPFFDEF